MPIFDRYLFADYSGVGEDYQLNKEICLYEVDSGGTATRLSPIAGPGNFSRDTLRETIRFYLDEARKNGERVIFGMDHQYGWPPHLRSLANFGPDWRGGVNQLFNGVGLIPPLDVPRCFCRGFNRGVGTRVFWSLNPDFRRKYDLGAQPIAGVDRFRSTEHRLISKGYKPKSADELGVNGSVAGQTICGLKQIAQMLSWEDVAWWPFDGLNIEDDAYKSKHVGVEVFPGLYPVSAHNLVGPDHSEHCRDARRSAEFIWEEDKNNRLHGKGGLLNPFGAMPETESDNRGEENQVRQPQDEDRIRVEGWIVGA